MRFITEFESCNDGANYHYNESIANRELGERISKTFNWNKSKNQFDNTLEIEAFPMDKWIEFKNKLFSKFIDDDYEGAEQVLEFIKDVESFGKPAGDTIINKDGE